MKIFITSLIIFFLISISITPSHVEARARTGSFRAGGYTSHGKGSHYFGGYVRSGPALRSRTRY